MYSYNLIAVKMMNRIEKFKINDEFFKSNNIHFIKVNRYSDIPKPSSLKFYQGRDSMILKVVYDNTGNLFFENLKFKKGNYRLLLNLESLKKINLKDENLKNKKIYFKNLFDIQTRKRKEVELNDVLFYRIDLKDTINVKLKRIE